MMQSAALRRPEACARPCCMLIPLFLCAPACPALPARPSACLQGSGLSEGSYVTLGALEVDDLAAVVQYLREEGARKLVRPPLYILRNTVYAG